MYTTTLLNTRKKVKKKKEKANGMFNEKKIKYCLIPNTKLTVIRDLPIKKNQTVLSDCTQSAAMKVKSILGFTYVTSSFSDIKMRTHK
jgi:hypothetical protein